MGGPSVVMVFTMATDLMNRDFPQYGNQLKDHKKSSILIPRKQLLYWCNTAFFWLKASSMAIHLAVNK